MNMVSSGKKVGHNMDEIGIWVPYTDGIGEMSVQPMGKMGKDF